MQTLLAMSLLTASSAVRLSLKFDLCPVPETLNCLCRRSFLFTIYLDHIYYYRLAAEYLCSPPASRHLLMVLVLFRRPRAISFVHFAEDEVCFPELSSVEHQIP